MSKGLPLSIRDAKPHVHATRLTGTRPDGLPDGVHTGGAWLDPDGMVWKPLDGRPYANCEYHYPTKEAEALQFLGTLGVPCFPLNWEVKYRNGRKWIVRKKAWIYGKDLEWSSLDKEQVLTVEQAVREANAHGWVINDPVSLGLDEDYNLFIVDMSSAWHYPTAQHMRGFEEYWRVERFFETCKYDHLAKLRASAHSALLHWKTLADMPTKQEMTQMSEEYKKQFFKDEIKARSPYEHVYGSFYRPISHIWATFDKETTRFSHNQYLDKENMIPLTWIFTVDPLPQDKIDRYELEWGWSPIKFHLPEK